MCKTRKNGIIVFYQPKEIRKITIIDIFTMFFGMYVIIALLSNRSWNIKSIFVTGIILIILASKYIAPVLSRKYNITIYDDYFLLENIEPKAIKIIIRTINSIDIYKEEVVKIIGNSNEGKFEYDVWLDKNDVTQFVDIITMKIDSYRLKIKKEIDKAMIK